MFSTLRRVGCLTSALLVLLTALGCGPGSATVSGRVTYQGEPLTAGDLIIYGANGQIQSGQISADGTYAIYKAPVGDVKMAVLTPKELPPQRPEPAGVPQGKKGGRKKTLVNVEVPAPPPVKIVPIPDRYKEPDKSGLNFTLKRGEQTIDLNLKE
jgi:hypothetical protein